MSLDNSLTGWANTVVRGWRGTDERLFELLSAVLPYTWTSAQVRRLIAQARR
jgi:hypothetical protein